MPAYLETVNHIFALGTIVLQIAIIVILFNLIFRRTSTNKVLIFLKDYTLILGFLISLSTVLVSLFYSEIIGFTPCELCWMQRIFLYPQLILFGLGLYKKDKGIIDYSLVMAIIGTLVSLFHVYIEHGGPSTLSCAQGGTATVSCTTLYVFEFSYITIPLMALTTGVFLVLILVNYKYMTKTERSI